LISGGIFVIFNIIWLAVAARGEIGREGYEISSLYPESVTAATFTLPKN